MEPDPPPTTRSPQLTYLAAVDAVRGNQMALLALLRRIRPRLVGYYRRRMGARLRGAAEAEDLAQEALLEICQRLPTFEPRGHREFRAWIRQILHHRITAAARRRESLPGDRAPIDSGIPGQVDSPSAVFAGRELRERVLDRLARLPANQAEVLRLHFEEGLEPEEIATRLGISPGNARVRLHRAREAMLGELRDGEEDIFQERV